MRFGILLAALLTMAAAAPARAQDTDVDGSKDHPMVSRFPGYYIEDYDQQDFGSYEFQVGEDQHQKVEGRYWKIEYWLKEGGKNIWLEVNVANSGDVYELTVVEEAGMAQQVEFTSMELAKILNDKGSVALHGILFDTAKATIKDESRAELQAVGDLLKAQTGLRLEIQGHTDSVGTPASNKTLSEARAAAVKQYLVANFSIAPDRLTTAGFGDTKPVADNKTEAGKAQNRRVELVKK